MPEMPVAPPAFLSSGATDSEHGTEEVSFDDERTTWNVHDGSPPKVLVNAVWEKCGILEAGFCCATTGSATRQSKSTIAKNTAPTFIDFTIALSMPLIRTSRQSGTHRKKS